MNSQKVGVQAPENIELKKLVSNLTFISFFLFVYMSVFYNIVQILFNN